MDNIELIAILSDAHGNSIDLLQAIETAKNYGATKIYFLGDSLGYIPTTDALNVIMDNKLAIISLRGNHEDDLVSKSTRTHSDQIKKHTDILKMLTVKQLNYIHSLPNYIEDTFSNMKVLFIHGSPSDFVRGYFYSDSTFDDKFNHHQYDYIFMGNTHIPFIRRERDCTLVNVGSVGLPRDDGRYGSFALFYPEKRSVKIIRYRLKTTKKTLQATFNGQIDKKVYELFDRESQDIGDLVTND